MVYALVCLALIFADQLSKALAFALYGGGERVSYWLGSIFGYIFIFGWVTAYRISEPKELAYPTREHQ